MLDDHQIAIVKETAPVVGRHAREITDYFYDRLFQKYPKIKPLFNQSHQLDGGSQRQALANAVVAYALNIDRLENLGPAVKLITSKHVSLGIEPEHYPMVGEVLLESIQAVLGDVVTPDILNAWAAAYGQLAALLSGTEKELYMEHSSRRGGWLGFKSFRVVRIEQESDDIKSFYLENPESDEPIEFRPGQYIAIKLRVGGETVVRHYSLSDAPGKPYLRISVKREAHGVVSNYLHDSLGVDDLIEISPPSGDFVLDEGERPVFLVTGGVGLTPAISMLNHLQDSSREIHFVHAAQNSKVHAFKDHVNRLSIDQPNVKKHFVYDKPTRDCDPDFKGFVDEALLDSLLPKNRDADIYFLGPKPFMININRALRSLKVPSENIRFEFFGPASDLEIA